MMSRVTIQEKNSDLSHESVTSSIAVITKGEAHFTKDLDRTSKVPNQSGGKVDEQEGGNEGCVNGFIQTRFVFATLSFLGVFVGYLMRNNINVAIIAMVNNTAMANGGTGDDDATEDGPYLWDESTQGLILSSFYWGYLCSNLPSGAMAERYGAKQILAVGIFLSVVCSLITPIVSTISWRLLLAVRIVMGIGQGCLFPGVQSLIALWIPSTERARASTIIYSGQSLGLILANMVTGVIIEHINWEASFYFVGGIGAVWLIGWELLVFNCPEDHPKITKQELTYLRNTLENSKNKDNRLPVPWKSLLLSRPIWANITMQVAYAWYFYVFIMYIPEFMHSVLNFSVSEAGVFVGLAFVVTFIIDYVHGFLADFLINRNYVSRIIQRKIVTCFLSLGTSLCLIALAHTNNGSVSLALVYLTAFFTGGKASGYLVNQIDLSPNFAGTIQGVANTLGTLPGIVAPIVIGHILEDQTIEEWRVAFWITAGIATFGGVVFLLFASAEEQEWNNPKQQHKPQQIQYANKC